MAEDDEEDVIGEFYVDNETGTLELTTWRYGAWVYIEDHQDCCSIGLTVADIDRVIDRLNQLKQHFHKKHPPA